MNRRHFLSALLAAPVVHEVEPVRRVYSFLWSNPIGLVDPWAPITNGNVVTLADPSDVVNFEVGAVFGLDAFDARLKGWYTPERVRSLTLGHESRMAGLPPQGTATVTSVDRERGEFTFGRR